MHVGASHYVFQQRAQTTRLNISRYVMELVDCQHCAVELFRGEAFEREPQGGVRAHQNRTGVAKEVDESFDFARTTNPGCTGCGPGSPSLRRTRGRSIVEENDAPIERSGTATITFLAALVVQLVQTDEHQRP